LDLSLSSELFQRGSVLILEGYKLNVFVRLARATVVATFVAMAQLGLAYIAYWETYNYKRRRYFFQVGVQTKVKDISGQVQKAAMVKLAT
jgi:hypothetical protein